MGDVVVLFAGTIDNPKHKMHACLYAGEGWFFRINTRGHWPGSVPLYASEETFLNHDSHIECGGPVEFDQGEIDEALRYPGNFKGKLSTSALQRVLGELENIRQLTPKDRRILRQQIEATLHTRTSR